MSNSITSRTACSVAALAALVLTACNGRPSTKDSPIQVRPGVALPSDLAATEGAVRFLENRVRLDPEDHIAYNKLGAYYLQLQRETGSLSYIELASKAAKGSLASLPPEHNTDGLLLTAQVEYAEHDFTSARDHSRQLAELEPGKSYPFNTLGDALLELGDYDGATAAFQQMERLAAGIGGMTSVAVDQRLARYAALRGDVDHARRYLDNALRTCLALPAPPRETTAWCYWQLGDLAFSVGDNTSADACYQNALTAFPDYFRALASLGRLRAAQGDLDGGIALYEQATRLVPDPAFIAALGDLYKLKGRDREAAAQYGLVEQIGHLSALNGFLYNRQLALFYADHDLKAEDAYQNARREYEVRKDVYGSDTLAWAALKSGKLKEAESAAKEALKLGTKDPRIWYHAGMIALAEGDVTSARDYLNRSLELNQQFDPLQAALAKHALEGLL